MKNILHITPAYFSEESVIGGGEKYVAELAKALAVHDKEVHLTVLSFGAREFTQELNGYTLIVKKPLFFHNKNLINPISFFPLWFVHKFDIIHVHQVFNFLFEISLIASKIFRKKIVATDHGGGGRHFFSKFNLIKYVDCFLAVSNYNLNRYKLNFKKASVIWGGFDNSVSVQQVEKKSSKIISIGRILPHKGFHHLIKAIHEEKLVIIGRPIDAAYLEYLRLLAKDKNVNFLLNASDSQLQEELKDASLAVFASTSTDHHDQKIDGEPELLGIAPLEAMGRGLNTILSNVGSYPEIAMQSCVFEDGNVDQIRSLIQERLQNPIESFKIKEHVSERFTWQLTAMRCLKAYNDI